MASAWVSSFSEDGLYFASCSPEGKLKIWETSSGILKQEFTPNIHLSAPCTCLGWSPANRNRPSLKKQKRKSVPDSPGGAVNSGVVALGTRVGRVVFYDTASAAVISQLEGGHTDAVNCLSWSERGNLFSGSDDQHIVEWNIRKATVKSKWKAGSEKVTSILVLPDDKSLLSASLNIKWWNLESKEVIKTFTGHASSVVSLVYVPCGLNDETYFISAASGDRCINAWHLNDSSKDKSSVVSFIMQDTPCSVQVLKSGNKEPTSMAAVSNSGILHVFHHQMNGKSRKPLKAKLTIQIVSDTGQNKVAVQPINIVGVHYCGDKENTILITYGNFIYMSFERIPSRSTESNLVLIRSDPRKLKSQLDSAVSKVKIPETEENVKYLSPGFHSADMPSKRVRDKKSLKLHLPMDERLNNLALKPVSSSAPPRLDNMAQLLIQGLHSKDKKILHKVLFRKEEQVIINTVARLPVQVIVPLVKELVALINGKCWTTQVAVLWFKTILRIHAGQLLANPEVSEIFASMVRLVESKLTHLLPLLQLRGRLGLLLDQIGDRTNQSAACLDTMDSALTHQDESSDEDSTVDDIILPSESDDNWDELSNASGGEHGSENMDGDSEHGSNNMNGDSETDDKDMEISS